MSVMFFHGYGINHHTHDIMSKMKSNGAQIALVKAIIKTPYNRDSYDDAHMLDKILENNSNDPKLLKAIAKELFGHVTDKAQMILIENYHNYDLNEPLRKYCKNPTLLQDLVKKFTNDIPYIVFVLIDQQLRHSQLEKKLQDVLVKIGPYTSHDLIERVKRINLKSPTFEIKYYIDFTLLCLGSLENIIGVLSNRKSEFYSEKTASIIAYYAKIQAKEKEIVEALINFHQTHRTYPKPIYEILAQIGNKEAITFLKECVQKHSGYAAEVLTKILDEDIKKFLIEEAKKNNYEAAIALGKLGDINAVPALLEKVKEENYVKFQQDFVAIEILGQIGDVRSLDVLLGLLEYPKKYQTNYNHLIEKVIQVLGEIGSKAEIQPIVKEKIIHSLLNLLEKLEESNSHIKKQEIAKQLGRLKAKRTAPILIEMAQYYLDNHELMIDPCPFIFALGEIGDAKAIPVLTKALNPFYPRVEDVAVEALHKMIQSKDKLVSETALTALIKGYVGGGIIQKSATQAFKELGTKVIPFIINELNSCSDVYHKEQYLYLLGNVGQRGDKDIIKTIKPFFRRKELGINDTAINAFIKIGGIDELIPLLKSRKYQKYHEAIKKALGEIGAAVTDTLELEKVRQVLWQTRFEGDPEVNWVAYSQVVGRLTELQVDELTQKEPKCYLFLPANS